MNELSTFGHLTGLLVQPLLLLPMVGISAGSVTMVNRPQRHAKFQSARYVADNTEMGLSSTCECPPTSGAAPAPAALAAVAIFDVASRSAGATRSRLAA